MTKLFKSKLVLWSSYLLFIASLIFVGMFYFNWMQARAAAPQVTFTRNGTSVTVVATPRASYELKFLVDGVGQKYWLRNTVTSANHCNARNFNSATASKTVYDTGLSSAEFQITVQANTNQYFCVKVLYGLINNPNSWLEHYALFTVDNTKPVVTIKQSGLNLVAKATDISTIATWQFSQESSSHACSSASYSDANSAHISSDKRTVTTPITAGNNNLYYCFAATDSQGNIGYSSESFQVDTVAPRLTANQDNATLTVSVTQDDDSNGSLEPNTDINKGSWQYVIVSTNSNTCDSSLRNWRAISGLTNDASRNRALITLTTSTDGKKYCFRVADNAANYGYALINVENINSPPVISSPRQTTSRTVTASASDNNYLNTNSWQYVITTRNVCNSDTTGFSTAGLSSRASSTRAGTVTIDLNQASVDDEEKNQWICVRVADNLSNNYGYRNLKIYVVVPTVTVSQRNTVLTASAVISGSSSWSYVKDDRSFTCDSYAFDIRTPVRTRRVNLNNSHINDYFCFKASDRYGNTGYSQTHRVRSLDTTAPSVSVTQSNDRLIIAATGQIDANSYGYVRTSKTEPTNCPTRTYEDATNKQVEIDENDEGYWYCVRASDIHQNYGYAKIRVRTVDTTIPEIDITRTGSKLVASSDATDLNGSSWQYVVGNVDDAFDCSLDNSQLSFNTASASNKEVTLSERDDRRYYCFRVKDTRNNYGYALSDQIIFNTPPVLSVVQKSHLNRIEVSTTATDVDGYTWAWQTFSHDPSDCSMVTNYVEIDDSTLTSITSKIIVSDIATTQDGHFYCFRVADTSDSTNLNYGYVKHKYDLSPPVVKFSLDSDTHVLTVSSSSPDVDHSTWRYAKFNQRPTCDDDTSLTHVVPSQRQFTLTPADNGFWLCFKVANSNSVFAYGLYLVADIDKITGPNIDITQNKYLVVATSASSRLKSDSWQYALTVNEPNCQAGQSLSFVKKASKPNTVDLTKVDQRYNWVCFKVSNNLDQVGYAKMKIDRSAPIIEAVQSQRMLNISAQDDNLDTSSWRYAKSKTDVNCSTLTTYTAIETANSITNDEVDENSNPGSDTMTKSRSISLELSPAESNFYYCISVKDTIGYVAYKKVQIEEIVLEVPTISLTQYSNKLVFKADDVDNKSWRYVKSQAGQNINCDNKGLTYAKLTGNYIALTEADNKRWFCVKVTGNNRTEGLAKILISGVDRKKPIVSITQKDDEVVGQADELITKWQYVILPSGADCNSQAFTSKSTIFEGHKFTLTASDNGKTYCFRAYDQAGNLTYKSISVDYQAPKDETPTPPVTTTTTSTPTPTTPVVAQAQDDDRVFVLIVAGTVVAVVVLTAVVMTLVNRKQQSRDNEQTVDMDNYL